MKGKNNSDRRNPSDIKRKEQQLTLKWFFLLSFARDASLSPVLSEITENTEESNAEEFKSDTDGKMEALQ